MSERYETEDITDNGTTWRTDITRDNGGIIPGRPHPVRLKDGERFWVKEGDQIVEYIHEVDIFGEQWRLVRASKKPDPRKRQPIVKVRRKWVWIIFRTWEWECQICYISDHQSTWRKAYAQADRHARNHHRSGK